MIKLFLLILIGCACGGVGFLYSKKYKRRADFFSAIVMLCQKFDVEINFSKERVKNIISGLDAKMKSKLAGIDNNYISYLDQGTELQKENLFKSITFLKEEEKDILFMFFKSLGRSDLEGQSKEIKNFQSRFDETSKSAQNDNKKYGSLSIKLGIIAGLFIIVLLI